MRDLCCVSCSSCSLAAKCIMYSRSVNRTTCVPIIVFNRCFIWFNLRSTRVYFPIAIERIRKIRKMRDHEREPTRIARIPLPTRSAGGRTAPVETSFQFAIYFRPLESSPLLALTLGSENLKKKRKGYLIARRELYLLVIISNKMNRRVSNVMSNIPLPFGYLRSY